MKHFDPALCVTSKSSFSHRIACLSKKGNQSEINNDLKWPKHVTSVSAKASKVLGIIKRNLWNCSKSVKKTPYTAIVRPKLEYACAAWVPYLQKDIVKLERIQRKAARSCTNNYHTTASVTEMPHDRGEL